MNPKQMIISEFVKESTKKYKNKIDEILLFGSVARGNYTNESDIDILVITNRDRYDMLRKLSEISFDIMLKYRNYISVKTLSAEEFNKLQRMNSSFIRNILKEGVILYERGKTTHREGILKAEGSKIAL